jgi:hypothetical protein
MSSTNIILPSSAQLSSIANLLFLFHSGSSVPMAMTNPPFLTSLSISRIVENELASSWVSSQPIFRVRFATEKGFATSFDFTLEFAHWPISQQPMILLMLLHYRCPLVKSSTHSWPVETQMARQNWSMTRFPCWRDDQLRPTIQPTLTILT